MKRRKPGPVSATELMAQLAQDRDFQERKEAREAGSSKSEWSRYGGPSDRSSLIFVARRWAKSMTRVSSRLVELPLLASVEVFPTEIGCSGQWLTPLRVGLGVGSRQMRPQANERDLSRNA